MRYDGRGSDHAATNNSSPAGDLILKRRWICAQHFPTHVRHDGRGGDHAAACDDLLHQWTVLACALCDAHQILL